MADPIFSIHLTLSADGQNVIACIMTTSGAPCVSGSGATTKDAIAAAMATMHDALKSLRTALDQAGP